MMDVILIRIAAVVAVISLLIFCVWIIKTAGEMIADYAWEVREKGTVKTYLIRRTDVYLLHSEREAYIVRAYNEEEAYALCEDGNLTKKNSTIKDLGDIAKNGVVFTILSRD